MLKDGIIMKDLGKIQNLNYLTFIVGDLQYWDEKYIGGLLQFSDKDFNSVDQVNFSNFFSGILSQTLEFLETLKFVL